MIIGIIGFILCTFIIVFNIILQRSGEKPDWMLFFLAWFMIWGINLAIFIKNIYENTIN